MRTTTKATTIARTAAVLLGAQALTACGLLYIPGDRAREARDVSSVDELRRQLVVFIDECGNSGAAGTIRNHSTSPAHITITIHFTTASGPTDTTTQALLPPDTTTTWHAPAPNPTTPIRLCGTTLSTITLT
ncbi:hypothetical protein [Embleya sp. NBC_00896]|uniref:hypothetical protein n=1 Tax=Embleya sp. NBC_00896 TaxID=2975961 RepID=UPI002F909E46|nr:hypothetical protein OG928_37070 [Embleya sp. NBC_00896]